MGDSLLQSTGSIQVLLPNEIYSKKQTNNHNVGNNFLHTLFISVFFYYLTIVISQLS